MTNKSARNQKSNSYSSKLQGERKLYQKGRKNPKYYSEIYNRIKYMVTLF